MEKLPGKASEGNLRNRHAPLLLEEKTWLLPRPKKWTEAGVDSFFPQLQDKTSPSLQLSKRQTFGLTLYW